MAFFVWDFRHQPVDHTSRFADFEAIERKRWGGIPQQCKYCGARIGAKQWRGSFVVTIDKRPIGDLCTDGQNLLLSPDFQNEIQAEGLTGLTFAKTSVEIIDHPEIRNYRVAQYSSVEQTLDAEQSGLEIEELVGCARCMLCSRKQLDKIVFAQPAPTLDVFRPSCVYGVTVVSQRFVALIKRNKFTNFHFVGQEDYHEPKAYL